MMQVSTGEYFFALAATWINTWSRAVINGVSYIPQIVPTFYTALSAGLLASNPKIYGVNSNPYVLNFGEVVEIVLINNDGGHHPWQ